MPISAMWTAVTGLDSFGTALSIVSDNIANANSTAFKGGTAHFGDLVAGYLATDYVDTKAKGAGTSVLGINTNFATGSSLHTGTWSDLMIQGNGFFNVQDSNGNTFYTRDGAFRVDENGYLTDMNGFQVLDNAGAEIRIEDPASADYPLYASYEIDKFGVVNGTEPDGTVSEIATLRVTTFPNQEGLIRKGNNLYTPGGSAGNPINGQATVDQAGEIVCGALEGSNVDIAKEMVNMIIYQADFVANSKAIDTANTMLQTVTNLVR